jgi:hypothetical protein
MTKSKFDVSHIERFKGSGLSLAAYCSAEGIKVSGLQYHLAKSRRRERESAAKFIAVHTLAKTDWFTLQIDSSGLRLKFNVDFRL